MFVLGVVVGRGTSPVTFDTSSFQERLRVVVGNIPRDAPAREKVDLDFFEELNRPVSREPELPAPPKAAEPVRVEKAVPPMAVNEDEIPVKRSLKLATIKEKLAGTGEKDASGAPAEKDSQKPSEIKRAAEVAKKTEPSPKATSAGKAPVKRNTVASAQEGEGPGYTIQVAAYRDFKDAVSQMSILQEKGFSSYRTRGEANGTTWYRVRTGTFKDFQAAQTELNRLKQAKINGMIIKKDD